MAEREAIIEEANKLTLSYDYDGAIDLIKTYQGKEGGYEVYPALLKAIEDLEAEKDSLLLYGGSYRSVTEFNHIFFHSLIADNSKAFDGDYDSVGYNMYMTTVYEFKKMMQAMYEDGYVLVSVHDLAKQITDEDGNTKFVPGEIYLPEGKKPFVLSQDDVNYYDYMEGDGFASRIVIGEDGKPTCEMILEDGSVVQGPFDIVPILDEFVEEHPDFSYKGAKGILALTGYEGALGYRTNDPTSPTYEQDKETVKEVARVLKENGWEFASHSWSHRNMGEKSFEFIKQDTDRWLEEVGSLIGPTDILIFPYGVDIERTMGHYSSNKYHYLKEVGFNYFHGVDSKPWMHLKDDYVRMTRRPLDGQAMLQFPERLQDLFILEEIIDPERPPMNW
ncbi:MAG: polysaccharide deacetylase family protein [Clostridiales bacterium]|nr:polysaccharide deacetylase family protein [Clostridiales bacterium]